MYEDTLRTIGFAENEIQKLTVKYDKTSINDLRLSVGLRYFVNNADRFPDLVLSIEAISNGLNLTSSTKILKVLQENFTKYLDKEDKISLLEKWAFSPRYKLGGEIKEYEHLMKIEQASDAQWHKDNDDPYFPYDKECYTGEHWYCQCIEWLRDHEEKIDCYLDKLVEKFYAMRCAMYHEAFPIFIGDRFEDYEGVTSYEVYIHGSGELESFMTDKTFDDMKVIFQKIIVSMIKDVKDI